MKVKRKEEKKQRAQQRGKPNKRKAYHVGVWSQIAVRTYCIQSVTHMAMNSEAMDKEKKFLPLPKNEQ